MVDAQRWAWESGGDGKEWVARKTVFCLIPVHVSIRPALKRCGVPSRLPLRHRDRLSKGEVSVSESLSV